MSDNNRCLIGYSIILLVLALLVVLPTCVGLEEVEKEKGARQMAEYTCNLCHEKFDDGRCCKKINIELYLCEGCVGGKQENNN